MTETIKAKDHFKISDYNPFHKEFLKPTIKIFMPAMIQSLVEALTTFIDVFLIGHYAASHSGGGVNIINALTAVQALSFIVFSVLIGAAAGCGVHAAQYFGAKKFKELKESTKIRIITCITMAFVFVVICVSAPNQLVGLILYSTHGTDMSNTIHIAANYLLVLTISFPIVALDLAFIYTLRDTRRNAVSMYVSGFTLIFRVLSSLLFIYGLGKIPALGLEGSAIGLIISRFIELIIIMFICYRQKYEFNPGWKIFSFSKKLMKEMLRKTVPLLINETLWSTAVSAQLAAFAFLGSTQLAGMQISSTMCELFYTIFTALAAACSVMIGNYLGANKIKKAIANSKQLLGFSIFIASLCTLLVIGISFFLPQLLFQGIDPVSLKYAEELMRVYGFLIFLWGVSATCFFVLRAGGDVKSMFIADSLFNIFTNFIFAFVISIWAAPAWHLNIVSVVAILSVFQVLKLILFVYLYGRFKWAKNLAQVETH